MRSICGSRFGVGVAFLAEEAPLEGQIGFLGHRRLEARKDLLRRSGIALEEVDRGHRQQLGRRQIAVLGLVDPPVGTVRLSFGGNDIGMDHRHHMREIV